MAYSFHDPPSASHTQSVRYKNGSNSELKLTVGSPTSQGLIQQLIGSSNLICLLFHLESLNPKFP